MSRTPHTAADTAMRDTQEENYIGGHYDALAAIGVSFLGPNGSLGEKNVSSKDFELVEDHLYDQFNVDVISISSFWAELWCHPALPEGRLPSSVGGLVAIWRDADGPAFWPLIGERGELEDNDESEKFLYRLPGDYLQWPRRDYRVPAYRLGSIHQPTGILAVQDRILPIRPQIPQWAFA
ncbi:hypothetical protein QBC39DRAFT_357023 [Podospora conica]|nr:hypothetical protein QBC39DRAFT_357023 [Schizothecium conicum]